MCEKERRIKTHRINSKLTQGVAREQSNTRTNLYNTRCPRYSSRFSPFTLADSLTNFLTRSDLSLSLSSSRVDKNAKRIVMCVSWLANATENRGILNLQISTTKPRFPFKGTTRIENLKKWTRRNTKFSFRFNLHKNAAAPHDRCRKLFLSKSAWICGKVRRFKIWRRFVTKIKTEDRAKRRKMRWRLSTKSNFDFLKSKMKKVVVQNQRRERSLFSSFTLKARNFRITFPNELKPRRMVYVWIWKLS